MRLSWRFPAWLVAALLVAGAAFTAAASSRPARKPAAVPRVVARVTALSGRALFVYRHRRFVGLSRGATIARGEIVVVGPKTRATLHTLLSARASYATEATVFSIAQYDTRARPNVAPPREITILAGFARRHHTVRLTSTLVTESR